MIFAKSFAIIVEANGPLTAAPVIAGVIAAAAAGFARLAYGTAIALAPDARKDAHSFAPGWNVITFSDSRFIVSRSGFM